MITVPLPFIFLFVLMGKFVQLNNDSGGKGISMFLGSELFPLPLVEGGPLYYDPSEEFPNLYQDAYGQVFFSVGVCVGVFYAYGSYNPIR